MTFVTTQPRELSLLDRARQALIEAKSIDDIKMIRDQAEVARNYAKAASLSLDIQNRAATIKLEAERKAGRILAAMQMNSGQLLRGSQMEPPDPTPTLGELGVSKGQSHRWQTVAGVPEDKFREYVDVASKSGREVTSFGLLKLAKKLSAIQTVHTYQPVEGVVTDLSELVASDTRFAAIYADPPWSYDNQATRAATDNHYPTMSIDELLALPIADLAAENAHLHLWTTSGFIAEALQLITGWGFTYRSSFVWVKPSIGLGNYWRLSHEFLLLGVRGKLPFAAADLRSWIEAPTSRHHSRKPEQVRTFIERSSPSPRLELFSRQIVPGWTVFGNQISNPHPISQE